MKGSQLVIKFKDNKAWLTEQKALDLVQLGLPASSYCPSPAYWFITVLKYIEEEHRIFAIVTSYGIGDIDFPQHQILLTENLGKVEIISFRSIDTGCLLATLKISKPVNSVTVDYLTLKGESEHEDQFKYEEENELVVEEPIEPKRQTFRESYKIPISDLQFKLGGVSFKRQFFGKDVEITIPNYDIRPEFDAVKNYFANILKAKKIHVNIEIQLVNSEITSVKATSPEIDKINGEIIDNVKFEFVRSTTKKRIVVDVDKSLFTMEEYLQTFGAENVNSKAFYNNDKELFEDLLAISNTKHYKHLRFLSAKHSHHIMKLRFIHKPFSFIFLLAGEQNYHIVWETLDTEEATYVWHVEKNLQALKMALRHIEDIINVIKVQGKIAYIGTSEDNYQRIYHDYSNLVDGFVKWKGELESMLL
jgi:hypothetical protein